MTFYYASPPQHISFGFYPPHGKPYFKHNYTNLSEYERSYQPCPECDVENKLYSQTRVFPQVGIYHSSQSRYPDGMLPRYSNHLYPCSNYLEHQFSNEIVRKHLDAHGLYWPVPWMKTRTQRMYARPTKEKSHNEENSTTFPVRPLDKVNSSLVETENGFIRNISGLYFNSSRPISAGFHENYNPLWMYSPPKWIDYQY